MDSKRKYEQCAYPGIPWNQRAGRNVAKCGECVFPLASLTTEDFKEFIFNVFVGIIFESKIKHPVGNYLVIGNSKYYYIDNGLSKGAIKTYLLIVSCFYTTTSSDIVKVI